MTKWTNFRIPGPCGRLSFSLMTSFLVTVAPGLANAADIDLDLDERGRVKISTQLKTPLFKTEARAIQASKLQSCQALTALNTRTTTTKSDAYKVAFDALREQNKKEASVLGGKSATWKSIFDVLSTLDAHQVIHEKNAKEWKDKLTQVASDIATLPQGDADKKAFAKTADSALKQAKTAFLPMIEAQLCAAKKDVTWDPVVQKGNFRLPANDQHHTTIDAGDKKILLDGKLWTVKKDSSVVLASIDRDVPDTIDMGVVQRNEQNTWLFVLATQDAWLHSQVLKKKKDLRCVFKQKTGAPVKECEVIEKTKGDKKLISFRGGNQLGAVSSVVLFHGSGNLSSNNTIGDFPVRECQFATSGLIDEIIPGAVRQRFNVTSSECGSSLIGASEVIAQLGGKEIHGHVEEAPDTPYTRILFRNVPSDLTPGTGIWKLSTTHGVFLGRLALTVSAETFELAKAADGSPELSVEYWGDDRGVMDWHSGASTDGAAVVSRTDHDSPFYVINSPNWEALPTAFAPVLSQAPVRNCLPPPAHATVAEQESFGRCIKNNSNWTVTPLTRPGQEPLQLTDGEGNWSNSGPLHLRDLTRLGFAVLSPAQNALEVEVALRDTSAAPVEWFVGRVEIARQARIESLAVPISQALQVECPATSLQRKADPDIAKDGMSVGVSGRSMTSGQCSIIYEPTRVYGDASDELLEAREKLVELKECLTWTKTPDGESKCSKRGDPEKFNSYEAAVGTVASKKLKISNLISTLNHLYDSYSTDSSEYAKGLENLATLRVELAQELQERARSRKALPKAYRDQLDKIDSLESFLHGVDETLKLVGWQELNVTIERTGLTPKTYLWRIDPSRKQKIKLDPPTGQGATGAYVVSITSAHGGPLAIKGRDPSTLGNTTSTPTDVKVAGLSFETRLRPRTRGAVGKRSRMFVTIPIDPVGVRFPASPSELKTSDPATRNAQLVQVRTGAAIAFEPWNYDLGEPLFAIPFRLEGGTYLFSVGDKVFNPALFAGLKVTLPLIDLPAGQADDLGSDATLGFLAEVPLDYPAARFLLTVGIDAFTLFGSK